LNFISDPIKRGEMIEKALAHLPIGGTLFIVLPLPCIANSRYFDKERFLGIMEKTMGTEVKASHHSTRLAMYVFEKKVFCHIT
jgi:25S rRNA (adenine2142-N1)-methyltransferase